MPELAAISADLEVALEHVSIPAYVLDPAGVVRWVNGAGRRIVGDVVGRQFSSLVADEETRHVREMFARKVAGRTLVTDFDSVVTPPGGERLGAQHSYMPLMSRAFVGFRPCVHDWEAPPVPQLDLTPRQSEVLRLLEQGRSTDEIASDLHLSRDTVRNHVRGLLRSLGVKSRLEAVALAHGDLVH